MRWLISLLFLFFAASGTANAQSTSGAICAPYEDAWAKVSSGKSVPAMDRVIANIPSLCSDLKDRAQQTRDQASAAKPGAAAAVHKAQDTRSDPELKIAFQSIDWLCKNISPSGFDIETAYTSFPNDKLVLQPEKSEMDNDQKHETITRDAVGQLYKVQYHYQEQLADQSLYGFSVSFEPVDIMSPLIPKMDMRTKFLASFGKVEDGVIGPKVGFGQKNEMLNIYPMDLSVWSTGLIQVEWFSAGGLNAASAMCKK